MSRRSRNNHGEKMGLFKNKKASPFLNRLIHRVVDGLILLRINFGRK
jgi:hypothetical protein